MMFDKVRWFCPVCHFITLARPGSQEATCERCGCCMDVQTVIFAIAALQAANQAATRRAAELEAAKPGAA
jgi:hypothetical protein